MAKSPFERTDQTKTCLSFWFPKIRAAGLPVPRTEIIRTDCELIRLFDGETPNGFDALVMEINQRAVEIGFPVFLRSGQTAAKHGWKLSCYLENQKDTANHIMEIVEYSEMASLEGLNHDVWVVREFLKTGPAFTAFFGELPITKERRYFVDGRKIICHHPYWPEVALDGQVKLSELRNWRTKLAEINAESPDEVAELSRMSIIAGSVMEGTWSIDWLWTHKGWYLTDMAPMDVSYHWPGCPNGA